MGGRSVIVLAHLRDAEVKAQPMLHSSHQKAAMIYQAALDERDYEIAARLSKLAERE